VTDCKRLWEVEAARDGRLSGTALVAFEEHASRCEQCRKERRALNTLARELAVSSAAEDEVALRRERARLLAAAHPNVPEQRSARSGGWVALAAACCLLGFLGIRKLPFGQSTVAPVIDVVASPGARWDREITKTSERLTLTEGVLRLTVRHSTGDRRTAIHVPDGDIDDVGTVFRVTVREGHTREIVVSDGAIVFRRPGEAPLLLTSPSLWTPKPAEPVPAPPGLASPAEPVATPPRPLPPLVERAKARSASRAPSTASSTERPPDEDLSYLRIVALRREGRSEEARLAAAEYLRLFPAGFRRADVLAFVRTLR
jgi:hypothetical protein